MTPLIDDLQIPWYSLEFTLTGHSNTVNCLAFNPIGTKLASGDDDGVVLIWTCQGSQQLQSLNLYWHGAISYLLWVPRDTKDGDTLLFAGCTDGSIHLWVNCPPTVRLVDLLWVIEAHTNAIQCLAYDTLNRYLTSTAGWTMKLWIFDDDWNMAAQWVYTHDVQAIARSMYFVEGAQYLMTCYLESHEVAQFRISDGTCIARWILEHQIGSTALSPDETYMAIGDLDTGVQVYRTKDFQSIGRYPQVNCVNVIKGVGFTNNQRLVVLGSDRGVVIIFERITGEIIQKLYHSCCE
ncbi:WD40 repeat-like protein [Ramaria rubella]|nr:WD40 repeat-like protein [Ramaria rubella]